MKNIVVIIFPNQACLKGFLLSLIRNAFRLIGPAVPPTRRQAVPPAPGVQFLQVDIQTKVRKIQELLEKSDFGKSLGAIQHVFLQIISMRV